MPGTRSSARLNASSSPQSAESSSGTKRKADESSPSGNKSKRGRPSKAATEADQKMLEEFMPSDANKEETKDTEEAEDANGEGESS